MSAPDPNTVPVSKEAISTILAYPIGKVRKDLGIQEYINYQYNWELFNTVWSYNYTISTLNGGTIPSGSQPYKFYQFMTYKDVTSYSNGQISHISFYSNAPVGQFNNIQG
jgi:hypothetical protein